MTKIPKGCIYNLLSNATCSRGSFRCDRKHREPARPPEPPSGSVVTAEMGAGWFVTVGRYGESVLTIEPRMLAGKSDLSDEDLALIRGAAHHLLLFAGAPR